MKKALSILLVLLLALSVLPAGVLAAETKVVMSPQNLRADGKAIACEKYNIDGSNYFKLRDVAMVLCATGSRFSVGWDGEKKVISVVTGEAYTPNGSELDLSGGDKSASAVPSTQTLLINGIERSDLSAYNIGGNNYFKLRDLGDALGFEVDYDKETNSAIIISRVLTDPRPWLTVESCFTDNLGTDEHTVDNYDPLGFLLSTLFETPQYSEQYGYRYDGLGRLTEEKYHFRSEGESDLWEQFRTTDYEYDKWGLLVKTVTVETNTDRAQGESIVTTEAYTYDDLGNMLTDEVLSPYVHSVRNYVYDERGYLIHSETTYNDHGKTTLDYVRDEEGRAIRWWSTLEDGTVSYSYENAYDANGVLVKETYAHDDYRSVTTFTYDERGNLISAYSDTTDWDSQTTNTYDEEGRLLEHVFYDGADLFTTTYTYDARGRELRREYESNDDSYVYEYTYDEEGNLLSEVYTGSDCTYRTDYTYDREERRQVQNTVLTYPAAAELVFTVDTLTLPVGDEASIYYYFTPYYCSPEAITWSTSDETVAVVDDSGNVTAVGPGIAVVTAISEKGLTASCIVTVVKDKFILTVSDTELKLKVGESTVIHCSVEVLGEWETYFIRRTYLDTYDVIETAWSPFIVDETDLTVNALAPGVCSLQLVIGQEHEDGSETLFDPILVTVTVEGDQSGPQTADPEKQLSVAGKTYSLGMTAAELTAQAGQPDEELSSTAGYTYYVFGSETYLDFLIAGVYNGKVVMLASGGKAFSYQGCIAGSTQTLSGDFVKAFTDKNDGGILHAVQLTDRDALPARPSAPSAEQLAGESVINFHMTNAFRVYHGLSPLMWSEPAAEAARLHSQDMADNNYFDHYSLDGRSPWDRMVAQGISYHSAAENISGGRSSGIAAYDGWVNSAGHRSNMLGNSKYLGVGMGYSAYGCCMTQDFFS